MCGECVYGGECFVLVGVYEVGVDGGYCVCYCW